MNIESIYKIKISKDLQGPRLKKQPIVWSDPNVIFSHSEPILFASLIIVQSIPRVVRLSYWNLHYMH